MTHTHHDHDPERLERSLRVWLTEARPALADREAQISEVLDALDDAPRTRARFLGRWFDRGKSDRRRADAHGHPPELNRRTGYMLTATAIAAAVALVALAANSLQTTQPQVFEASGTTHTVATDGSATYSTISEAIAAAGNGDEITVAAGTYPETLHIDKNVAITGIGDRADVVVAGSAADDPEASSNAYDCLEACSAIVTNASPKFTGLTFTGGVRIEGGAPTVSNVAFDDGGLLATEARLLLSGSTFTVEGLELDAVDATVEGNAFVEGADIAVWRSSDDSRILGNDIDDGLIVVWGSNELTIEGNTFRGSGSLWEHSGTSIHVGGFFGSDDTTRPRIIGNRFEHGMIGIKVLAETVPHIEGNEFVDLSMAVQVGRSPARIVGNEVTESTNGIVVVSGGDPMITDNVIDVTGRGIVAGSGTSPVIEGNTVCGGEMSIFVSDGATPELGENQTCEGGVTG